MTNYKKEFIQQQYHFLKNEEIYKIWTRLIIVGLL